jgi:UDP-N-acetylmuramate: L-alanyl-gamma-D-glutamyl-meso-diaminopimelate ligase
VINNIEFDHADIFNDLDDIQRQFHHLVKIIPGNGNIVYFKDDKNTEDLLEKGSWSSLVPIGADETYQIDLSNKQIISSGDSYSLEGFVLFGSHNIKNITAAITATHINGIEIKDSISALKDFEGVKRRLEIKYKDSSTIIIDDFAHHPTAIKYAIDAVKDKFKNRSIMGFIELGSNTMIEGVHGDEVFKAAADLDESIWLDKKEVLKDRCKNSSDSETQCLDLIKDKIDYYDILLIMTNKNSKRLWEPIIEHIKGK